MSAQHQQIKTAAKAPVSGRVSIGFLSKALTLVAAGIAIVAATGAYAQSTAYDAPAKPAKAAVEVLALSASASVYLSREEIYLATVSVHGNTSQLAKLVDSYPEYGNPIMRSVLVDRSRLQMSLIRDLQCDTTGRDFFLIPGEANIFDTTTRSSLQAHSDDTIPCFTVVHADTRLAKAPRSHFPWHHN